MTRKLAYFVRIDSLQPIAGADAIEAAKVGGWTIVVKKGEFQAGDIAVYFEIDSFLPDGNPGWQFLVDKQSRIYQEQKGHVLRTIRLRGQLSQGLLVVPALLGLAAPYTLGQDLSEQLGVLKYEPPIAPSLSGVAIGAFPSIIRKTDQERIQNLANELAQWQQEAARWEITEKLEGSSCTFAWIDNQLHVCSRNLDLQDTPENSLWNAARKLDIAGKMAARYSGRNLALQGEIIGHGVQGNIYKMQAQEFYLYDVYDADRAEYFSCNERIALAQELALPHVPVIDADFVLDASVTMESLLAMADGNSVLNTKQLREGLVFKQHGGQVSFKAISNQYLLKS
ncbi:MAG: RNA ligase (ATP) [Burkholderiales bacterium]|nr:RNA ligase (ATP) [Burkholderiales bacterium]